MANEKRRVCVCEKMLLKLALKLAALTSLFAMQKLCQFRMSEEFQRKAVCVCARKFFVTLICLQVLVSVCVCVLLPTAKYLHAFSPQSV